MDIHLYTNIWCKLQKIIFVEEVKIIDELGNHYSQYKQPQKSEQAALFLVPPRDGPMIDSTDTHTRNENFRRDILDKARAPINRVQSQFGMKLAANKLTNPGM